MDRKLFRFMLSMNEDTTYEVDMWVYVGPYTPMDDHLDNKFIHGYTERSGGKSVWIPVKRILYVTEV